MAPRLKIYRTYRFIDKDPVIDAVKTCVQDEKLTYHKVGQISGVADATLSNWFDGDTRKPNNCTVTAVTSALGYVRHDRIDKSGNLVIGFEKQREYDWQKEIERNADFMLAQGKKPRKREKKNGKA
jgi:hypothetical protein